MQHDLGLAPRQWGWVIGAFTIAYAIFEIPSGAMGDRVGPRKVLTRIVLWWSAFTAITGAVTGFGPLLLVRFLFGAGEAGAFPNCTSTVSRWIPAAERARATSVFWMATGVGGAVTPFLVVTIQQTYSWRVAFYVFGSLGLFWAAFWYWWFRDTPKQMAGVSEAELAHIGNPAGSSHGGVPWKAMFRNRNFQRLLVMYHLYCWGAYFYLSWVHTYLQVGRGLTENEMKIAASLPPWFGIVGVFAGGFLSDRLVRTHSLRFARCSIGSVALIVAGCALLTATVTKNNWYAVGLMSVGLGVMNAMLPVAWSICLDLGRQHAGAVSAAMNTFGQLGSFLSAVSFGYLVEWLGSYDLALMPLAAALLLSGAVFATINPSDQLIAENELAVAASS
jgi:sugar phosphate permease